jgi:hypothetical protein
MLKHTEKITAGTFRISCLQCISHEFAVLQEIPILCSVFCRWKEKILLIDGVEALAEAPHLPATDALDGVEADGSEQARGRRIWAPHLPTTVAWELARGGLPPSAWRSTDAGTRWRARSPTGPTASVSTREARYDLYFCYCMNFLLSRFQGYMLFFIILKYECWKYGLCLTK